MTLLNASCILSTARRPLDHVMSLDRVRGR
jgi:hypothetical protein